MSATVARKDAYKGTLQSLTLRISGRSWAHVAPRYVFDRLALSLYQRRHPDHPWLTATAVEILASWLRPGDCGLEWGSGRSTVWLARRVRHVISVEHHDLWYDKVRGLLDLENVSAKVDYRRWPDGAAENPTSGYVLVADDVADESLDFALVDGVARDHCAKAALGKIRPGGLLIVDNCNWFLPPARSSRSPGCRSEQEGPASAVWKEVHEALRTWRCIWTSNGVTDTAIWVRPH